MIIEFLNGSFDNIILGNYGFDVEVLVKENNVFVDISTFTGRDFIFTKPSDEILTVSSVFVTDGTDGKLKYSFIDGDLDENGEWKIRVKLIDTNSLIQTVDKTFIVSI